MDTKLLGGPPGSYGHSRGGRRGNTVTATHLVYLCSLSHFFLATGYAGESTGCMRDRQSTNVFGASVEAGIVLVGQVER